MNIFISAGQDLKLNVWKVESGYVNKLSGIMLEFDLPTVVNHIEYKLNEGSEFEYFIAACQDGSLRVFNIDGDIKNLTITKTIHVADYPLLQLALKEKSS